MPWDARQFNPEVAGRVANYPERCPVGTLVRSAPRASRGVLLRSPQFTDARPSLVPRSFSEPLARNLPVWNEQWPNLIFAEFLS
jgi:hypothetical protein